MRLPDDPSSAPQNKTLIIGIGNEYRSDDGIGVVIANQIKGMALPETVVLIQSGEGASLMECWKGFDKVIIIDAVRSGSGVGKIHRLNPIIENIPSEFFHYSTHAFSLAESVELARTLESLPEQMTVYGIEGENFAAGQTLTKEVADAAQLVVHSIVEQIGCEQKLMKSNISPESSKGFDII